MQLASEPAALLLTRDDEPLPGELQLLEKGGGVDCGGQRSGEQAEQALVGRVEPLLTPA